MKNKQKYGFVALACVLLGAGALFLLSIWDEQGSSPRSETDASANEFDGPESPPPAQNDLEGVVSLEEEPNNRDLMKELFQRIDSSVSGLDSISEARMLVAKWLTGAFNRGDLTIDDLASQLADSSVSVMARVIYAEAMLGLFPEQIGEINASPIALTLADVNAPVLSTLIIDVLAHSEQPELMPYIADAAKEPIENIRLAAIRAATAFPGSPVSRQSVISFLADEENYKVRSGAIQALSKIDPDGSFPLIMALLHNSTQERH